MDAIEVYRNIIDEMERTKEAIAIGRPHAYSSSPQCLEEQWRLLDKMVLFILKKNHLIYGLPKFCVENGMGPRGLVMQIKLEEHIEDENEIYKRMLEWRERYEQWRNEKLIEDEPALKEILQ